MNVDMRKLAKLFAAAALLVLVAGCGALRPYRYRMADIQPGMSPEEVTSVLGNPDMRGFEGDTEEWKYYSYINDDNTSYILIHIVFIGGEVYSMDSHRVDTPVARPELPHPGHDRHEQPRAGVDVELHAE